MNEEEYFTVTDEYVSAVTDPEQKAVALRLQEAERQQVLIRAMIKQEQDTGIEDPNLKRLVDEGFDLINQKVSKKDFGK
jgi:hypothetical protein